jgi:chromosome partitioning protein
MGKVIAIANQKGGVGKTTTAVNLSSAVGFKDKKVLLIDLDPQGNATSGCGINKNSGKNSYDILVGDAKIEEAIVKTEFKNLSIVRSSIQLAGSEIELIEKQDRAFLLKNAISFVKSDFDYIFIDCPPSLGLITINALTASDTLLVPIQCEFYALEGLTQLISTVRQVKRLYNEHIDIEGVLLTMYQGRLNLTNQVVDEVKRFFPKKVYKSVIPRNVRISEAPSYGQPILYYDKNSAGAKSYNELAHELLKRNGGI